MVRPHPLAGLLPAAFDLPPGWTERVLTPALVVRLDRVRHNVARVLGALGGDPDRWRPHVKTTKMPEVWLELVRAGVRHFKCATTREAGWLLETLERAGVAGDVLVAYPLVGPGLARLGELAARYRGSRLSVLCEDERAPAEVPRGVGIFLDLNPGMDRTGLPLASGAELLRLARAAGPRLRGVHCYEGHLTEPDEDRRRAAVHAGYAELARRVEELARSGLAIEEVVTAGTPAFLSAAAPSGLAELAGTRHRVSPGTVVFHDARSAEQNPGLALEPAATVLARVVSRPSPGRITCDAGSKSLAAEAGDRCAVVIGHPELLAEAPSEEHLPFAVAGGGAGPARGALLHLVPRHVCPTVNLADEALLVDGDSVRVVPVAARGHELLLGSAAAARACWTATAIPTARS